MRVPIITRASQLGPALKQLREPSVSPNPGDEVLKIEAGGYSVSQTRQLRKDEIVALRRSVISLKETILAEQNDQPHEELKPIFEALNKLSEDAINKGDDPSHSVELELYAKAATASLHQSTQALLKLYKTQLDLRQTLITAKSKLNNL
jgi:hypothetical protein